MVEINSNPIKINVIEDNIEYLESLCRTIKLDSTLLLTGTFHTGEEFLCKLSPKFPPDIVLVDINLGANKIDGIETVRKAKLKCPDTKYIFLTNYGDMKALKRAQEVGADSYIQKDTSGELLLNKIIHESKSDHPTSIISINNDVLKKITIDNFQIDLDDKLLNLSQKEIQVLSYKKQGLIPPEIAKKMGIKISTVHTYMKRIYKKLKPPKWWDMV